MRRKKDVAVFWIEIEITKLIDEKKVEAHEVVQQSLGRTIGQAGVHLVEEIARAFSPDALDLTTSNVGGLGVAVNPVSGT